MKNLKNNFCMAIGWIFLFALSVISCSSNGSSANGDGSGQGILSLSLTDASTTDYKAAYVTIQDIKVLPKTEEGGAAAEWIVAASPNKTYNLLELINGITESLGSVQLAAGDYDEMRVVLGTGNDGGTNILGVVHPYANYIIDASDTVYELTLPEGSEAGYAILDGFAIPEGGATDLILDFNVIKSIVQAGESGEWYLAPAITVVNEETLSQVSGTVTDSGTGALLEGAVISAQQPTSDGSDMDIVVTSTISDGSGNYTLMLSPGTYTIVSTLAGYVAQNSEITVVSGTDATLNFSLEAGVGEGTLTGAIIIENGDDGQYIAVSVRKTVIEDSTETTVEVASANVANGGQYAFDLPAGTYSLVAVFTANGIPMTLETGDSLVVTDGGVIHFDIVFSNTAEDDENEDDCGECANEKVYVCHKGRTIHISESALKAHLAHGDVEGECSDEDTDDDGSTGEDSEEGDDDTDTTNKVQVCHKGRSLWVSEFVIDIFLNHGDLMGECGTISDACDDESAVCDSSDDSEDDQSTDDDDDDDNGEGHGHGQDKDKNK